VTNLNELTLSPADSPAKMLVSPGSGQDWTAAEAASGQNTSGSFAFYDPASCSWRTYQGSLFGGLEPFSETWPRAGTMQNGIVFQQPPLVPHTSVGGFSSWPTPTAMDSTLTAIGRRSTKGRHALQLAHLASSGAINSPDPIAAHGKALRKRWPTPAARDWKDGRKPYSRKKNGEATQDTIGRVLAASGETEGGLLNPTWVEWLMGFPIGWTDLEDSETL
jgi:hypothetical protein